MNTALGSGLNNDNACGRRKHASEAATKTAIWAARLNGRSLDRCEPRYCNLCHAWHIVRVK